MNLEQFPEKLAFLRLASGADIPTWAEASSILSITATATETALLCAGRNVPTKVPGTRGLIGFVVTDPGDDGPGTAGVLLDLLTPLAEDDVAVLTLTTHSTVWVLVPGNDVDRATEAWRRRGHTVAPAVPA